MADIYCRAGCNEADNRFTFTLGDGFAAGTPVMATADNGAVNPQLSATTAAGGETLTVTIPANTNLPEDRYEITVTAGRGNNVATAIFYLDLVSGSLVAPSVLSPQDAATDVSPLADLAWNPVEDAIDYEVALARDAGFTDVLTSTTAITATTLPTGVILNPETTYHWRVRARSACGNSPWATFSFTTASELCSGGTSDDTPVVITEEGNQTILASLTVSTPINLAELEVAIDVTHTFVGDLDADLRGPDGTTIRLFNTIQQGGCPNDNMSVIFRADAVNTSADFENTCTANDISVAGIFQPAESFNAFAGAATTGTWTLVLRDNAGLDAGSLDKFTITACGDVDSGSFSVTTETQRIAVCPDDPANLQLRLGGGFTSEVSLRAEANDQALDNFTFNFNTNDRLLNVDFSNWVLLASGDYNLRITLITGANAEHSIMLPLTIRERTEVATLVSPAENAAVDEGAIRFIWNTTPGVNNYTFEYSLSEDFSTVAFSEETTATELTIDNLPTGQPLYWRVRTSGECGTATSEVRSLTLSPTGVQDFGNGRTLSVYPNPVKDFLTVEAKGNWPTGVRAGLFDAAGRYVRTYTLNGSGRENWPLGNLAAGVYYLRFDGAGTRRTERLVVLP
ncbi:MAG: proprotein convertase P-domain-containing protein [Bacteroidota bacterium]